MKRENVLKELAGEDLKRGVGEGRRARRRVVGGGRIFGGVQCA